MIAGEEGFHMEDEVWSSMVWDISIIFGCPVPNNFGGKEPIKYGDYD